MALKELRPKMNHKVISRTSGFAQSTPILTEDVVARQPLSDVATIFHRAGFDLDVVLPWLTALSDEILSETSNEDLMWEWIKWKSGTAGVSLVARLEEGTDLMQLQKLGLILEAVKIIQQQFSFEKWRERNMYTRMTWWIEEARYVATIIEPMPHLNDNPPPFNRWIINDEHFKVPTYYVSQDARDTLHSHGEAIIDNLLETSVFQRDDNLVLFHGTSLRHVTSILHKVRVDYRVRTTDFSADRAFYTSTSFERALHHSYWRWHGCKAIIVFVLPVNKVKSPGHYLELLDDREWQKVVAWCSNGNYLEELKGKAFIQGKQLCNPEEVIETGLEFGLSRAAEIARSHEPLRHQVAVTSDSGAEILDSAAKYVIVLP
ncbi:hypothetical protein BC937DRAFT_87045 [Endogone sp. FLAS-F59071]|nr:hypothetical protein BC937DRAFT_87045 [Endogone sp. FLAS-F59071]|eukprot:RUS22775.1 hypothetical protein BC937DRAFT_87045 [Endogone sp. FLAS-F59071]